MTKDEALKLAMEALRLYQRTLAPADTRWFGVAAVAAIEQALAAPVQERAERVCSLGCENLGTCCAVPMCEAVTTNQPAAQPHNNAVLLELLGRALPMVVVAYSRGFVDAEAIGRDIEEVLGIAPEKGQT
jgi:hypothetical protein